MLGFIKAVTLGGLPFIIDQATLTHFSTLYEGFYYQSQWKHT